MAVSSEGALFEYAPDVDVAANLAALRDSTPEGAVVVGSATSYGEVAAILQHIGTVELRPRSRVALEALAARAGWKMARILATAGAGYGQRSATTTGCRPCRPGRC